MKLLSLLSGLIATSITMSVLADNNYLLIEDFQSPEPSEYSSEWRLVEDGVMGGVSQGVMEWAVVQDKRCLRLTGLVSTKNNGGFIQLNRPVDKGLAKVFSGYTGIELEILGNNESYNVHLKQRGLFLPWQSFRSTIVAKDEWQQIKVPFDSFTPYKTSQKLKPEKINQIAIVGIGRDFNADVCVAAIRLYR
jgi:hypothetical protein